MIATARDKVKGEAAIEEIRKDIGFPVKISLVLMDLASFASVDNAAKEMKKLISSMKGPKLDMLILNVCDLFILMIPFISLAYNSID